MSPLQTLFKSVQAMCIQDCTTVANDCDSFAPHGINVVASFCVAGACQLLSIMRTSYGCSSSMQRATLTAGSTAHVHKLVSGACVSQCVTACHSVSKTEKLSTFTYRTAPGSVPARTAKLVASLPQSVG